MTREIQSAARDAGEPGICRTLGGAIAISLLFGLFAYGAIQLTLSSGRIAAFWIGNAMLVGMLLGRGERCMIAALCLSLCTNFFANLLVGDPPLMAIGIATANILEVSLVIWLLDKLHVRAATFDSLSQFAKFTAIGALVPVLSGLFAASTIASQMQTGFLAAYAQWLAAHCLPIPIFGSMVLIMRNAYETGHFTRSVQRRRWIATAAAVGFAAVAIFAQTTYPLLFLAPVVVVFAAFMTGRVGTAIVVAFLACAASLATLQDMGPIALVRGGPREEIIALQTFLAACLAVGLPVAVVLSNRTTIRNDLKESRDFVTSILDGVGDLVFKFDSEWRFTYINWRWEELSGNSQVSLLREAILEQAVAGDLNRLQSLSGFENRSIGLIRLIQVRIEDGSTLQLEVRIEPQFDEHGAFCGAIGTASDVTEVIAHNHALEASEARFRQLAEAAPVGIFRADAQGSLNYVNSVWLQKFGLEADDMIGDGWKTALATGEEYESDPAFSGFNKPGDVRRRVIRFKDKQGEPFICETVNSAEFDEFGNIVGFVGVMHDVTEQQRSLERLRDREEQLSLLADNATDAVLRLDLNGVCTYASPSSQQVFEIDHRLLVGNSLITGFHEEDAERVSSEFAALASGKVDRCRIAFRSRSLVQPDNYRWLEANCAAVRDPDTGKPTEVIASLRNVDKTKRLEEALVEARDRAEAAVDAKSAFLANMSHEIRTPMNGVIGFTELALSGELEEDQRRNLEMIADSGRAMLRLLNDLLDFAKIESGQMQVANEPTDIAHKLRGALRLMEPVAVQKGLSIDLEVGDDVPAWIFSDPMRVRQIILNLVGNSLKFTETGSVTIRAGMAREEKMLEIAVSDTGIGIAADQLETVFQNFTQADASIARRYGGSGLGLTISSQLAELLGGTLHVESEVGRGSTFTLSIPAVACAAPEREEEVKAATPLGDPVGQLRILVAEDNTINQRLTLAMLEKEGHCATLAEDGQQAIELVAARHGTNDGFDLVLMDMQMPNLDGLAATRKIRGAGISAQVLPIIAVTANAYQEDIDACREAGMQGHLSKPLRMRELAAVLQSYGNRGSSRPADEFEQETDPELVRMFAERKADALEIVNRAMRENRLEGDTIGALASLLHQIAGVAAFFGQELLGEESRNLENELLALEGTGHELGLERLQKLLAA